MATSVRINTPILTADELADSLGIHGERRSRIEEIARKAVASYYAKATPTKRSPAKRSAARAKKKGA
jgi:hypothetical protein